MGCLGSGDGGISRGHFEVRDKRRHSGFSNALVFMMVTLHCVVFVEVDMAP